MADKQEQTCGFQYTRNPDGSTTRTSKLDSRKEAPAEKVDSKPKAKKKAAKKTGRK